MSNLKKYYTKLCACSLSGGWIVDDGEDTPIPDEIKLIIQKYNHSENDKEKAEACYLLSKKLHARFVWNNIPALQSIIHCDQESIEASSTEIFSVESNGEYWPIIKAHAYFDINFKRDFGQNELFDWERENDHPLTDCVSFYWKIDNDTELHIEDDMNFCLIEST